MSSSEKDNDLDVLRKAMRADWDRRIAHDYRFWMSDGQADDQTMWSTGERDLQIICRDIDGSEKTALEIGCGVGRIVKAASNRFAKIIGLDVSETGIKKAHELLQTSAGTLPKNVELICGDGTTLPVASGSIDVVYSFAALVSMPTKVIAHYLTEAHRVLKPHGILRIQLYLGENQIVGDTDTLHLRCFGEENFRTAVKAAGFGIEWIDELKLPFKVSFEEIGMRAMIVSLERMDHTPTDVETIANLLIPEDAKVGSAATSDLEYWMTLNYADELANKGEIERARRTLEYAESVARTTSIDVRDLLTRIVSKIEAAETVKNSPAPALPTLTATDYFAANLTVLKARFPILAEEIGEDSSIDARISITPTAEGNTVVYNQQQLDHPQKPVTAAAAWVKRTLSDARVKEAKALTIFGFGGGYHVEAMLEQSQHEVSVFEPRIEILRAALTARDLKPLLSKIHALEVGNTTHRGALSFNKQSELVTRPQHLALFAQDATNLKTKLYGVRGLSTLHPTIGVVGPLQGGTLPITAYTMRGLGELRQRVREFDMSGFAQGFHQIDSFFYDKYRLAALHGSYLEMLSQVILESVNEKPVDILIFMAQAPMSVQMLSELRKRGTILVLWFLEDYLRFTYWREISKYFDFVFTIQKGECIDEIKKAGAGAVHYLPAACDPFIHAPVTCTEEERNRWGSPVSFVGAGYHNRQQMFASLAELPFKIWGTEWPTCRPFDKLVQESGRRLTPNEYVKIFNSTDININLHSSTERDGIEPNGDFINPRTFELAAAGAFQLVDERVYLADFFKIGEEIITFSSVDDLKNKIRYYLNHPEERRKVAEASRARVLREHTYVHRLEEMLSVIYSSRYEQLKKKELENPWHKMLTRTTEHPELHDRCEAAFKRGEEPVLDGLVTDIVTGKGKLTETEQKLLFLFHVKKQIIRMKLEELGPQAPPEARRGGL